MKNISMALREFVFKLLQTIVDPRQKKSIVECGYVLDVKEENDVLTIQLQLSDSHKPYESQFTSLIKSTLSAEIKSKILVIVQYDRDEDQLKNVKHIIAVSSCKGGVGKSSVSVNLAFALAEKGFKVGIFDADIYGPSLPTMVAHPLPDLQVEGVVINPVEYAGVKLMSFGYTQIDGESGAAVLRGPMVSQIIQQLLCNTRWGDLDYLVIDFPPGTGDVQLTLGQLINIDASVIVTTPQYISFIDVVKGIEMFDKLKIPTVSVIENMSYFTCDNCSEKHYLYGKGNMQKLKNDFGFKHSYAIPIEPSFSKSCDSGSPFVMTHSDHDISKLFLTIASDLHKEVQKLKRGGYNLPRVDFDQEKGILIIPHQDTPYYVPSKVLRYHCGCAKCTDEFSGKKLISDTDILETISPLSMNPVGNYALGINWSDGHSSLYPYGRIRDLVNGAQ